MSGIDLLPRPINPLPVLQIMEADIPPRHTKSRH
jgi:hypothetical protein